MAGTTGSNNPYPSLLVVEQGSTPATPASGRQRLFIDSADGRLKRVDSDGNVFEIEVGADGTFQVLTADPASPADDTGWFFRDGGTPESLILRVRRAGVTVPFNLGTFES